VYSCTELKENLMIDESCVLELESLKMMLENWSLTYLPHPSQREAFFNTLTDDELLINYCAVFLIDDLSLKAQVMKSHSIKEKINLLVNTLGPKEIQLSQFLPPLKFNTIKD
jgi:hypothetical protein